MASFPEIVAQLRTLDQQAKDIEVSVDHRVSLDNGYELHVKLNGRKLDVELITKKTTDVTKMPLNLVEKYVDAMKQIKQWRIGQVANFPSI